MRNWISTLRASAVKVVLATVATVFEEDRVDRSVEGGADHPARPGRHLRSEADRQISTSLSGFRCEDHLDVCPRHDGSRDTGASGGALRPWCVTGPDLGGHRCWRRPANGRTGHSTKGCAPGNPTDRDIKDAASNGRNLHPKPIHLPPARLDRVKHDPPFRLNPRRSNTRAFAQSGFNEVRTVRAAYPEDGPHRTLQILLIRLRLGMVFRNRTHSVVTNLLAPVVG